MSDLSDYHPFIIWCAYLHKRGLADFRKNDVVMNDYGARRFTVGVETAKDAGLPVIGLNIHDAKVFREFSWNTAGMVMGQKNKDWIAFAAKDVRHRESIEPDPVPLRLWVPYPQGVFDVWLETQPERINIKRVKNGKGSTPQFEKAPFMSLPLSIKNKWEDLEKSLA
jgi:hypothetical protein